jgi:hypothetical protein
LRAAVRATDVVHGLELHGHDRHRRERLRQQFQAAGQDGALENEVVEVRRRGRW